jgi:hypothetical protein
MFVAVALPPVELALMKVIALPAETWNDVATPAVALVTAHGRAASRRCAHCGRGRARSTRTPNAAQVALTRHMIAFSAARCTIAATA